MFTNIHTKQKMFINMILAQIGFAFITIVAVLSGSQVTAIIIVNIVFAVIIAYTNYSAMIRITGGIDILKRYMEDVIDFAFMRSNRIAKAQYVGNDEIGLILAELNKYVDQFDVMRKADMQVMGEIVLTMDKMSQGIYKCRVNSTTKNFMLKALVDVINHTLDVTEVNMGTLRARLTDYTNDDFTQRINIDPKIKADLLLVMNSVNELGQALNDNTKINLSNGQTLESNANSMSESVNHLAHRANQQAASLEETAAAIEEITSITRNNADSATQMSNLSRKVQDSAKSGQKLATSTANAMDEINTQVNSINEAISVIDQIAFQTNILSLNAAVEAATAGEAGKGFAVVAQEVRNLASRSAEAAKSIKDIVESATKKASEGKQISDNMIKGYEELDTHVNDTMRLIQDVTTSTKEQMQGVEQINDAITTLDRATQENASEANNVASVASEVSNMANALVSEAKAKKFK